MSTNKIYADFADRVLLRDGVVDLLPDFFAAVPVLDAVFFGFTVLASFLRLLEVDLLVVAAFDVGVFLVALLRVAEVDRPLDADLLFVPVEAALAVFFLAAALVDLERALLFVAEDVSAAAVPAFFVRVTLLLRRSVFFSGVGVDFFASAEGFFLSEDLYNQIKVHDASVDHATSTTPIGRYNHLAHLVLRLRSPTSPVSSPLPAAFFFKDSLIL